MRRTLLLLALALSTGCAASRPALARSWILGKPLDLGVVTLDGEPVALGGPDQSVRAIVLWATWCRSCYQLFPALDVLAASAGGRSLSIHAISLDEDAAKVREAQARVPPSVHVL